ncbi:MAG: metalloregulator ArsR/SmtB family transcription factor [bacterium]
MSEPTPVRGRGRPALPANPADPLEPVFRALADPTRRRMLDLLREKPRTTHELCEHFDVSRYAVMQHLTVLEDCNLVLVRRQGRERWNHVNAVPLQAISERWISPFSQLWASGLLRLRDHLESSTASRRPPPMPEISTIMPDTCTMAPVRTAQIEQEIIYNAPIAKVWEALTRDIGFWWGPPHGDEERMRDVILEPTVGGRFYEDYGNGQGRVFCYVGQIAAPNVLQLRGPMGIPTAVDGVITFELTEEGNATRLKLSHTICGMIAEETGEGYTMGWNLLLATKLKAYVEDGTRMGIRGTR